MDRYVPVLSKRCSQPTLGSRFLPRPGSSTGQRVSSQDLCLAIQGQMIRVFRHEHVGDERFRREAASFGLAHGGLAVTQNATAEWGAGAAGPYLVILFRCYADPSSNGWVIATSISTYPDLADV